MRTSEKWASEAMEDIRVCLDCTDWDVFRTATNNLDEYTEAVTSYSCVLSHTRVSCNNNRSWFTAELSQLKLEKEEAFRSGTRTSLKSLNTGLASR